MTTAELRYLPELTPIFFHYWVSKADQRWAEHAWGILAAAGAVPTQLDAASPDYAQHVITLAALAHLSDVFADGGDASVEPELVTGDDPRLTDIQLGRYAERFDIHTTEWPESAGALARNAVRTRLPEVAKALADHIGLEALCAELWTQRRADVQYPLTDELLDAVLQDADPDKGPSFTWLRELVATNN